VIRCPRCGQERVVPVKTRPPAPMHPDSDEVDAQIKERLGHLYDEIRRARETADAQAASARGSN
jgi:DNA-directed RNA polymerase subunit RPC12/RpoP